jgi:hypothetical protein
VIYQKTLTWLEDGKTDSDAVGASIPASPLSTH